MVGGFCLLAVLVGRCRGLGALLGLAISIAAVAFCLVPALAAARHSPALIALSTACAVMGVVLYLTHGRSLRTTTAFLGTVAGLAVTAVLAGWAADTGDEGGPEADRRRSFFSGCRPPPRRCGFLGR